jgi:hypothetical protein
MKTTVTAYDPAIIILTAERTDKLSKRKQEEITNTVIDPFNEHIHLNAQFEQKINNLIGETEFAYPKDGVKIQKTIDAFVESSHLILSEYLKRTLDLYFELKPDITEDPWQLVALNEFTEKENTTQNHQWLEHWMDQLNGLKTNVADSSANENEAIEFCYYTDVTNRND